MEVVVVPLDIDYDKAMDKYWLYRWSEDQEDLEFYYSHVLMPRRLSEEMTARFRKTILDAIEESVRHEEACLDAGV